MYDSTREVVTQRKQRKSMVKDEYRKGYAIDILPWQKGGVMSASLWPSQNQVIRIVPGYDESTGEVFRQNVNTTTYSLDADPEDYLSGTFCKATVISKFGDIKSPFITDYEPGSPDERQWGGNTVIHAFTRAINNATSKQNKRIAFLLKPIDEWYTWVGISRDARLSFDKTALLMQALVFTLNGRDNTDLDTGEPMLDEDGDIQPLFTVLALDHKTSIRNLEQALVEPLDPGKPLDAATNNKYGAMAEMTGRKLYLNTYVDSQSGFAALRPSVQAAGAGWTPVEFDLDEDTVKALWVPWGKLLKYMTAREQLLLCAQEFGADTVNYVIGSDPYFRELEIPEEIKCKGLGRYAAGATQRTPATPRPAQGLKSAAKPPLYGVQGKVDANKVMDTVRKMRMAASGAAQHDEEQSSAAASLLDGMDEIDLFDGKAEVEG